MLSVRRYITASRFRPHTKRFHSFATMLLHAESFCFGSGTCTLLFYPQAGASSADRRECNLNSPSWHPLFGSSQVRVRFVQKPGIQVATNRPPSCISCGGNLTLMIKMIDRLLYLSPTTLAKYFLSCNLYT
jgi:hypothetical protein